MPVVGEWLEEMVKWLEGFPWKLFCTLTFRPGLSEPQARWRLRRWAEDLGKAHGDEGFGWVGVPESGKTGQDFHFHVLVMGLRDWHAAQRMDFMRRWSKGCGDGRVDLYMPGAGGIRYIFKAVGPSDMDRIELHLAAPPKVDAPAPQSSNAQGCSSTTAIASTKSAGAGSRTNNKEESNRGMEVKKKNGNLIIQIPMEKQPSLSASGKSMLVATSAGPQETAVTVEGRPVRVIVNAFFYPEKRSSKKGNAAAEDPEEDK